jgi:hypothetical protein
MEEKTIIPVRDYSCGEEDGDDVEPPLKGMRKMSLKQQKKFPIIATDSLICQSYYTARCKKCVGCSFAIDGCEKVVEMAAG